MAVDSAESTQKRRPGILGKLVGIPLRIAIVVLVSLICSVVIEWLGIAFEWWHLPGAEHARVTMEKEIGWLDTRYTRSLLVSDPVQVATWGLTTINEWLFVKTGIAGWLADNAGQGGILGIIHTYTQAAMYVALMTLTRCIILALTSPLFFLAALVGFVDGLVRRDLRRFGAGQESSFIYHHAKRLVGPVFVIGWLIYLSVPFSIHPNLFLVPAAAFFGLLISVTTGSFKKYL